jgi:Tfp pilus assembly protein PilF
MLGTRICLIIALVVGSTSIAGASDQIQSSSDQFENNNPEAYEAFRKGWEHYRRETPVDFGKAASYFEQAIQIDPDYARSDTAIASMQQAMHLDSQYPSSYLTRLGRAQFDLGR